MIIDHIYLDTGGYFRADADGIEAGTVHYSWAGDEALVINSAYVHPAYSGEGIALVLLREALDFARANGVYVIPECPYARKMVTRYPDMWDIVPLEELINQ